MVGALAATVATPTFCQALAPTIEPTYNGEEGETALPDFSGVQVRAAQRKAGKNHMSLSTITADYFGHKAAAMKPVAPAYGTLKMLALANAALAVISLVVMFLFALPWLAALVFATIYTLFCIDLRDAMT